MGRKVSSTSPSSRWQKVISATRKRRPELRQEMRKRAVAREPKLVQAEAGHG